MTILSDLTEIKIKPGSELEEIIQNVKTILTTIKGSVPLDRDFGTDKKILDLPISIAKAKISAAIVKAVHKFEPRVKVKKIIFNQNDYDSMNGILKPSIEVEIKTT